jgi:phenylacetate-coenzyme A ligase PaaK-like adenylate-forming protein
MPLLRYDTGDLSHGNWINCSCSKASPMIRSIYGRKDDYLIAEDRSRMSTINLYTYFSKLKEIKQFQIIQNAPGALSINILFVENSDKFNKKNSISIITEELIKKTNMHIEISSDKEFIQSSEGKIPAFIQKIKDVS